MIVERRVYSMAPGTLDAYVAQYREEALAIHREHLGNLIGYFTSGDGGVDQVTHLWGYADHTERERRRAALYADPRWLAYLERMAARDYVAAQDSCILRTGP